MSERVRVALVCDECGARNYHTTRQRARTERLTKKKHCPTCGRHTVHRESR